MFYAGQKCLYHFFFSTLGGHNSFQWSQTIICSQGHETTNVTTLGPSLLCLCAVSVLRTVTAQNECSYFNTRHSDICLQPIMAKNAGQLGPPFVHPVVIHTLE